MIVVHANDVKNVMNVIYAMVWLNLIIVRTVKKADGCNIVQSVMFVINALVARMNVKCVQIVRIAVIALSVMVV